MQIADKVSKRFQGKQSGLFAPIPAAEYSDPIIALSSADPFAPERPLPSVVRDAMTAELDQPGASHYQECLGIFPLRKAITDRLEERYHKTVDPDRNVLVTPGSEIGLMAAVSLLLDPGDEVIIPDPSYATNFQYVRFAGGIPVSLPLSETDGYQFDRGRLEARVTPRTKAVILTHPNNPTGTVYSRSALEDLRQFVLEHDLFLICDMAFEDHIYDNTELLWPAAMPGLWERTISLFTMSKGFALCGLRVGYMIADTQMLDHLLAEATPLLCSTNQVAQAGAAAALRDKTLLREYFARLDTRRRETCRLLNQVPGVSVVLPQGGIHCWVNVSALGDSAAVAAYLRATARVSVSEGSPYGLQCGKGHFRLVFGAIDDDETYYAALNRLCAALGRYPGGKH